MAKLFYDHETGSVPFWKRGEDSEIRINALSLFMANVKPEWQSNTECGRSTASSLSPPLFQHPGLISLDLLK